MQKNVLDLTVRKKKFNKNLCQKQQPEMPMKKVFLKILQNSQKNICARVYFSINLQASGIDVFL